MSLTSPLPRTLAERHRAWLERGMGGQVETHARLARDGQTPGAMVISCCDSRVNPTALFDAGPGEYFIHRNIANFVPASDAGPVATGTAAALQYAVTVLKVPAIVVVGHSACGGIAGCHAMARGEADDLKGTAVGDWVGLLRPALERLPDDAGPEALEREAVRLSIENLMSYDFVREAVESGSLTLHALWTDIGDGRLEEIEA